MVRRRIELVGRNLPFAEYQKLNSDRRLPLDAADKLGEIQFRVLAAYRLPDSLALAGTAEPGKLPRGLVVAALLGSEFASAQLSDLPSEKLRSALEAARADWRPPSAYERSRSLYDDYLHALSALFDVPPSDAPDFMRSQAWAAKSCLAALGGWAQMRHTFVLQAKESAFFGALADKPPGFIEPNPEFFSRVSAVLDSAQWFLEQAKAFEPSGDEEASRLRRGSDALQVLKLDPQIGARPLQAALDAGSILTQIAGAGWKRFFTDATDKKSSETLSEYLDRLTLTVREAAQKLERGELPPAPSDGQLRTRWDEIRRLTRRLESLAHQQLRQQPWTTSETEFIKSYGAALAFVMGYGGNAWLQPRDDAPRWTSVASDPQSDRVLAIGVGRARIIHVLYPWKGEEILCQGAVMSYHEYATQKRLNDQEWKTLPDSKDAPALPDWLAPYVAQ